MWGILGPVLFTLTAHPRAMDRRRRWGWAEHAVATGKPRLQAVGDALDRVTLEIRLTARRVLPELELAALETLAASRAPVPLVMGSGAWWGRYVVDDVRTTARKTDGWGRLVEADAELALTEWANDPALLDRAAEALEGLASGAGLETRLADAAVLEPALAGAAAVATDVITRRAGG